MNIRQKVISFVQTKKFLYFLIGSGVILRLKYFLEGRTLWLDEAWLSSGVSMASLKEIFFFAHFAPELPLPPTGFLIIEKCIIEIFGSNEYALRLFPFMAAIIALFIMILFLKRYGSPKAMPITLGLFAFNPMLVYYAAEVKQYSSDVMVALVLFIIADDLLKRKLTAQDSIFFGLVGCFALYLSHTSVFVLAPIGLVLFLSAMRSRDGDKMGKLFFSYLCWGAIFFILYMECYRFMLGNSKLSSEEALEGYMMPLTSGIIAMIKWIALVIWNIFQSPANIYPVFLGVIFFSLGLRQVFKSNKDKFFVLLIPLILLFTAGILNKYPFRGRFILFCCPSIFLFVSEGCVVFLKKISRLSFLISLVIIAILFYNPIKSSAYHLTHSRERYGKRIYAYFKEHYQKGDAVFLNTSTQYIFGYYKVYYQIENIEVVGLILDDFGNTSSELDGVEVEYTYFAYGKKGYFRGHRGEKVLSKDKQMIKFNKRTWVIFSYGRKNQRNFVVSFLDQKGIRLAQYEDAGAYIYLYDLSR